MVDLLSEPRIVLTLYHKNQTIPSQLSSDAKKGAFKLPSKSGMVIEFWNYYCWIYSEINVVVELTLKCLLLICY